MRRAGVAFVALALVPAATAGYGPPERDGTITAKELSEVSGLSAASVVPRSWWVVNDGGNAPDLHLISGNGHLLATVRVRGASNVDWEDLASGPGPRGRRALYVGDIGDNDKTRTDLVVYRIVEPSENARTVAAEALPFRYPDGHHDAEALFVDPASGRIFIVTKTRDPDAEPARVYGFPLPLRPGRVVTLLHVAGSLARLLAPVSLITAAAVSPDGTRLAIRTYFQAWEWRRRPGSPFSSIFAASPERVPLALERQGESISYTRDGKALVTTSEQPPVPLWRMSRTS